MNDFRDTRDTDVTHAAHGRKGRPWGPVAGMVAGGVLLAAGLAMCTFGMHAVMNRALETLGDSGIADPRGLSAKIGEMRDMMRLGAGAGVAGLVALGVSFMAMRREDAGE